MSHRHVCYSEVPPSVIQAQLVQAGIRISYRTDEEPRALLPDGTTDNQVRWFWLRSGIKIRWGVTTTPRRDHPEDANRGARVFAQGKKSGLDEAVQILQDAIAAAVPPAAAPEPPQPEADP